MEQDIPLTHDRCVHIRSPSLNQTLTFPFDHTTTVDSLKQSIQTQHPHHPAAVDQRIIFRGKVLLDTEMLSNILEKIDNSTIPTFHLVVKPSLSDATPSTTRTALNTLGTNTISPPSQPLPPTPPPSYPSLNTSVPSTGTPMYLPGMPALVPGGYQVVAINGQYYLAPVLVPAMPTYPTSTNTTTTSPPNPHIIPPPGIGQARMIGRPRALPRGATLWLALKLAFVLFITCHGASIERILFFHFLAMVFFMYQTGRFRLVIRRVTLEDLQNRFQPPRDIPIQPQQPVNAPTQPDQQNGGDTERQETPSVPLQDPSPGQDQDATIPPSPPTTRLSVLKRGAFTFVASLWPNYGHDPRLAQAVQNDQEDLEQV